MKEVEKRYSKIYDKFPREFLLLQGQGCEWKKCTYCDYFHDVSENFVEINQKVIEKITGEFGVLDVINSGSIMELDGKSLNFLIKKAQEKNIKEIWFEAHWIYRNKLADFSKKFPGINVKYRFGVETFNPKFWTLWKKGIPECTKIEEIKKYFRGICLLVGIKNQNLIEIEQDINTALNNFEHIALSIFVQNSTDTVRDENLIQDFLTKIYPKIKNNPKIEILINNTDLGVG